MFAPLREARGDRVAQQLQGHDVFLNARTLTFRQHALDRRAQRDWAWRLVVVDIASDQNVSGAIRSGEVAETFDRNETRLTQSLFLGAKLFEDFSDLPVGLLNESHRCLPDQAATIAAGYPEAGWAARTYPGLKAAKGLAC